MTHPTHPTTHLPHPSTPPTHQPIHPLAPQPRHRPTGPPTGPPTQLASNCPVDTMHPVMLAERQRQHNAAEHRAHAASGTWQKEEDDGGGSGGDSGGGGGDDNSSHRTSAAAGRAAASEGRGSCAPSLVAKAMQRVPPAARAPCWARPVLALASIGGIAARSECPRPSTTRMP